MWYSRSIFDHFWQISSDKTLIFSTKSVVRQSPAFRLLRDNRSITVRLTAGQFLSVLQLGDVEQRVGLQRRAAELQHHQDNSDTSTHLDTEKTQPARQHHCQIYKTHRPLEASVWGNFLYWNYMTWTAFFSCMFLICFWFEITWKYR